MNYTNVLKELSTMAEALFLFMRQANISFIRNHNYAIIGKGINQDLLNHPELLEQNATLAFEAAL
jgi:hypothetical protein